MISPLLWSSLDDADRWRARAAEARKAAERAADPESKIFILNIAAGCERLAALVHERVKKAPPGRDEYGAPDAGRTN
jgi:hypothetical protein